MRKGFLFVISIALLLLSAPAGWAQPDNDNFANRTSLTIPEGYSQVVGYSLDATMEPGEFSFRRHQSVWYEWTPPVSGVLNTEPSGRDFRIYEGTNMASLRLSGRDANGNSHVVKGTSYAMVFAVPEDLLGLVGPGFGCTFHFTPYAPNDLFAQRTPITGKFVDLTSWNWRATRDAGEPSQTGQTTLWWAWTATENGIVALKPGSFWFTPVLTVFTGNEIGSLTPVPLEYIPYSLPYDGPAFFRVTAGKTYNIALGAKETATFGRLDCRLSFSGIELEGVQEGAVLPQPGEVQFSLKNGEWSDFFPETRFYVSGQYSSTWIGSPQYLWPGNHSAYVMGISNGFYTLTPPVRFTVLNPNDHFQNSIPLTNWGGRLSGLGTGAAREPGEPPTPTGTTNTVWWSWVAPGSGRINFQPFTCCSTLEIFEGTTLTTLVSRGQATAPNGLTIPVEGGKEYKIRTSSTDSRSYVIDYSYLPPAPPNDLFVNSLLLTEDVENLEVHLHSATAEAPEQSYYQTAWYTRTFDSPGIVSIYIENGYGVLYQGSTLSTLQALPNYFVTPGTYHLQVRAQNKAGIAKVNWRFTPAPTNDNFANSQEIPGSEGSFQTMHYFATLESGETRPSTNSPGKTLWYHWTAPSDGVLLLQKSSSETVYPALYTGAVLTSLTKVILQPVQNGFSWRVQQGGRYNLQLDTSSSYTTEYHYRFVPRPLNDEPVTAIPLAGTHVVFPAATLAATASAQDPPNPVPTTFYTTLYSTVWWNWRAPVSGFARVSLPGPSGAVVAVYQGPGSELISTFTNDYGRLIAEFEATAGSLYYIMVGDRDRQTRTPVGFESEGTLDLTTLSITAPTPGALLTQQEPPVFTATYDPLIDGEIPVLTYEAVRESARWLIGSAPAPGYRLTDPLLEHGAYKIVAVGTNNLGIRKESRPLHFRWRAVNDEFAGSIPLSGYELEVNGTVAGASQQPGEPFIQGGPYATVWYSWIAPASGRAIFDIAGVNYYQVFRGDSLESLTPVTDLNVEAGVVYHFMVYDSVAYNRFSFRIFLSTAMLIEPSQPNYYVGEKVPLAIESTEPANNIVAVEYLLRDRLLARSDAAPFSAEWTAIPTEPGPVSARVLLKSGFTLFLKGQWISIRPLNDDLVNRIKIEGSSGSIPIHIPYATTEPGDPSAWHTAWYSYQPAVEGALLLKSSDPTVRLYTEMFEGEQFQQMFKVPTNGPLSIATGTHFYPLKAGAKYSFGIGPDTNRHNLLWEFVPRASNDDFASALPIADLALQIQGTLRYSTTQPSEPRHRGINGYWDLPVGSVWYKWTATENGILEFKPRGKFSNVFQIGVYTGDSLATLKSATWLLPQKFPSLLKCHVEAGRTYFITFADWTGANTDLFSCELSFIRGADNDNFANSRVLAGRVDYDAVVHYTSTREPGEPSRVGDSERGTLWWSWTAPRSGIVAFTAAVPEEFWFYTRAYKGNNLATLELVAETVGRRSEFPVEAGTTYHFSVSPERPEARLCAVDILLKYAADNDAFASAHPLTPGVHAGWNYGTTREFREPIHAGKFGGRSVWFKFTSPGHGIAKIDLTGFFDAALGVYAGNSVGALQEVAGRSTSTNYSIATLPGRDYYLAVDGLWGATGEFDLALDYQALPDPLELFLQSAEPTRFHFQVSGLPPTGARLESSSDLLQWTEVMVISPGQTSFTFQPGEPVDSIFFRVRSD